MRSVFLFLFLVEVGCSKHSTEPETTSPTERLAVRVEQERQSSVAAVEGYAPKVQGRIDELAASAANILRQLPSVAEVEVLVAAAKPSHRIVHLRDWHFVPYDLYAVHVRQQVDRPLSDEDVDKLYQKHLLAVELVQLEQVAILRCLVRHHGLKRVLVEGLTAFGQENYNEIIGALRDMDDLLSGLRKARDELKDNAPEIDRQIDKMVRDHRRRLLEYGAAAPLEMDGQLQVLPLDARALLGQAKPINIDGKLGVERAKLAARRLSGKGSSPERFVQFHHSRRGSRPFGERSEAGRGNDGIHSGDDEVVQGSLRRKVTYKVQT